MSIILVVGTYIYITLEKELAVMAYSPAILYFGLISPIIMCSVVYTIFWIHQKKTQKIIGYQEVETSDTVLSSSSIEEPNNTTKINNNFDELFVICEEDEFSEEEKELLNDEADNNFEADIMGFQSCELIVDKKYSVDNKEN